MSEHHRSDVPPVPAGRPETVDDVVELLRAQGGRATPSRRVLLETLFGTDRHLTADELTSAVHEQLPDVHLTTIYRNLDELQKLGVVSHSHLGHGPVTYQLAAHAHAHLICNGCGVRIGVDDAFFAELTERAERSHGFTVDPHHVAIFGTCASCRLSGRT